MAILPLLSNTGRVHDISTDTLQEDSKFGTSVGWQSGVGASSTVSHGGNGRANGGGVRKASSATVTTVGDPRTGKLKIPFAVIITIEVFLW
jgi:hypothetical protein